MDDVYTYLVRLPDQIEEMVVPCLDGYTVYIDQNLTPERRISAFRHALRHIVQGDHEKADVVQIERNTHEEIAEQLRNSL